MRVFCYHGITNPWWGFHRQGNCLRNGEVPFAMHTCPHCTNEICVRKLRHHGLFTSFRLCPHCGGSFTVDPKTKYRQASCLFLAVVSLAMTLLLHFQGSAWMISALGSYVIVGVLIYWGNTRVRFVPYHEEQHTTNDT